MQISAPAIPSEANSTNINHHQTTIDNNNNQIIFNLQNMSGTVPPDPSPSPPIKSSTLTTATATTSSTKIYSSPNMNNNNNYNNNNSGTSALELLDSSPVRIRTINNSATTSLSTNQHVAVKSTQQQYGEGMNPHSSSSTAPPPTPPTSHQYPIPTRMNFNSSPHEIKNSRIHSSEHVSIEDNFKQNSIESNVREQYGKSEHTQHQHNKYQQYGNNNIYQSPNEGFIGRQHEEEEYHRTAQHHQWDYPYHHSSQRLSSWDQSPSSLSSSPLMSSRGKLSEQNNNLSSAEIQKEQANFVYGNNQKNSLKRTHGSSAATTTGSVEKAEAEEYYHHSHPQQHYRTHSLPAYSRDIRTSIHHQEVKPVQNNNNPSVQIINQKNTSTSPLIFATGSSSPQVPTQHHQVYGRNSGHNYYHNQYQQQQQYDKENNRYIVERNNYYQATPSLQHTSSIETQPASLKQVSSSTTHSNIMQQPFIIQPSMQPSSGIPSFQHQVHSSNAATNPNSFHVPSNYQQHHHHSQQQHYQPPPQPSSNYLNAQQQQQQSSYSSPNSNQPNSSEPKLRVYNSNLKVPEGIFSYDNTTLTCEPHGFKPNDRRGAPQTTHSVYVSDVLVVSCDLVAMANQPGIFQNCTARLVHLMGKNAKKKRKEGGSDQQDDGLDSEDDDMEDGKKKKKKNKKKEQEDSLDGDFMTDFSQAGMLESFELLSEQPCQENVQKGKIVSSLKVPRVRGRDCKTKTGQIQVLRFKGTEREHIIAVSDLFWIRSRTRTEMEVRKFKKQQQQSQPSHPQPPQQQIQQPPQHEPSNLSLHHPQHSHHSQHPQPQQVPSNLNPPRENFHNSQWPNIVQPNSPSTNDHAVVPLKKRRNNSPGGGTPNSYRVPPNPAASIVHSSSYFPPSSNIPPISHQDNGKLHNHHDTPHHHISYQQHQPSRTEPTYQELLQRVHMLEEKLNRLESKLTRTGHISPDFPLPDSQISPFLPSSAIHPRPVEPPKTSSFTPFPIDVFIKDDKRGENPALPSVVSSDSQPAIFNPKSPLPSFPFDPSDSFLKNSFSPPGFANPTSSSSSESGKREH